MASGTLQPSLFEKATVESAGGVVASQNRRAAEIGAAMLAAGGNAVDAAVATGFAVGLLEPWMSGLGGCGYMIVAPADGSPPACVDFGTVAPRRLDPADYPLLGGGARAEALFDWPAVEGDRNNKGPHSIALPSYVAGMGLALERFGTRPWAACLAPAIALAREGLPIDWFFTLSVAVAARELAAFPSSAAIYLPQGYPPLPPSGEGALPRLKLPALAATLERLAEAGPADFYKGAIAQRLVADLAAFGSKIDATDLASYEARILPALQVSYRDLALALPPGLTAGPTLARALAVLETSLRPGAAPDAATYAAFAAALDRAYRERLAGMGHAHDSAASPSSTTHISVVDRDGMMVSLTQTLLSRFGSKLLLPQTGILMNNGILWFDPEPGRPNSLAPGKRPLSNMVPTVASRAGKPWAALGASGGRRILPAVLQVLSFLADFQMDLKSALAQPRIDASGNGVTLDERLPADWLKAMPAGIAARRAPAVVYPVIYASPNAVMRLAEGRFAGLTEPVSPWSGAAGV